MLDQKKSIWSWAMYDWANSAFATTVMAGFFPIFFAYYWSANVSGVDTTARLGFANSIASLIVALLAPFLGAIADKAGSKKKFLFTFAFIGIVMTGGLFMVHQGQWQIAAFMYVVAAIGFSGGNIFYDSFLPSIASEKKVDYVSSLGFAMGYIGGGLLFAVNVLMYLMPAIFGLPVESVAVIPNINYENNKEIILPVDVDFTIPVDFEHGKAVIVSEFKVPIQEIAHKNTDQDNMIVLTIDTPLNLSWNTIEEEVIFKSGKSGKILSLDSLNRTIELSTTNQNIAGGDSVILNLKSKFTYTGFEEGKLLGIEDLSPIYGNATITSDYLKPSVKSLSIRLSFLSVAIWWLLFSIPLLLFVKESKNNEKSLGIFRAIKAGWLQLITTFKEIQHLKVVGIFLLAYWFYIDGVDTIIRMAISIGTALGFPSSALIVALLIVQFVAFGGALLYGLLAKKIGAKQSLYVGIIAYAVITMIGFFMSQVWHFYALAVAVGLFQGGIQAISRSLYSRIIPANKSAEFYGFFNLLGKFAAVIGPSLMAIVALITRNARDVTIGSMQLENMGIRYGVLSILILFLIGGLLLRKVDIEEGKRQVKYLK